jgi:membrane dipeptidase
MKIVDAHLDLAYNALRGRQVLQPAREQKADEEGIPSVGLPDLRAGGVVLLCATIFCEPDLGKGKGYKTPEEAAEMGWAQMRWYHEQFLSSQMRLIARRGDIAPLLDATAPRDTGFQPVLAASSPQITPLNTILLIEGADPILNAEDLPRWFDAGARMIGLAWKRTRYAGGTGMPGPLSAQGVALVDAMDRLGMVHDVSHLAEEAFWQLLERSTGPVAATHSNCRAIVPTDRQLSDAMITALAKRGGVIGINFYDRFLLPASDHGHRRANLADVIRQVHHMADLLGNTNHIGIGTDMDGGLGREQIPQEIRSSADLPLLADALSAAGYGDEAVHAILAENWLRFFAASLPA